MSNIILQKYTTKILEDELLINDLAFDFSDFNKEDGLLLYNYQIKALKNVTLFLKKYFSKDEENGIYEFYKRNLSKQDLDCLAIGTENENFKILKEFYSVDGNKIKLYNFINRACFWMATGSGKTLIIVKLIELLYKLMQDKVIPDKKVLIVAPDNKLLEQIKEHIEIFNKCSSRSAEIFLKNIKEYESNTFAGINLLTPNSLTVYYTRSTLLGTENKENVFNFRDYLESDGWYLILDEAHKGDQESSKRKHLLNILSKNGFLFNFSATFTDFLDEITTIFNFNLPEFIKGGYGKNIKVLDDEYKNFKPTNRVEEQNNLTDQEKKDIILKSLIVFTAIKKQYEQLKECSKVNNLNLKYHNPLLLTISNEINTKNADMKLYFKYLAQIAKSPIDSEHFNILKKEILKKLDNNWKYVVGNEELNPNLKVVINSITYKDILIYVFNSESPGEIEVNIISDNDDELSFRLKTTSNSGPFALIKASKVKSWRKNILDDYIFNDDIVIEKSRFNTIDQDNNGINILMGSRIFIEGWNSNRPNVINFINMGTDESNTKLVLQAIGRGVRIEPFKNDRRRLKQTGEFEDFKHDIQEKILEYSNVIETLFIFATNKVVIKNIIQGIDEDKENWELIKGIKQTKILETLYFPDYKEIPYNPNSLKINKKDFESVLSYIKSTPIKLLLIRDEIEIKTINSILQKDRIVTFEGEEDSKSPLQLINIIQNHYSQKAKVLKGFKKGTRSEIIKHYNSISYNLNNNDELSKQELIELEIGITNILNNIDKEYSEEQLDIIKIIKKIGKEEVKENKIIYSMANSHGIDVNEVIDEISIEDINRKFDIDLKVFSEHYYNPIILSEDNKKYKHIIKNKSEIDFLERLDKYLSTKKIEKYDWWYFSKIDESVDYIYIPYYDSQKQIYRKFYPDFIFWFKKSNKYYIKFIDPKGLGRERNAIDKIKGFKDIFDKEKIKLGETIIDIQLKYYNKEHAENEILESYRFYDLDKLFE